MENKSNIKKIDIEVPSLKRIRDISIFEDFYYSSTKDISYFNDIDKIINFIKEAYKHHKKDSFWICVEFAFAIYALIEDYFIGKKNDVPEEVTKAFNYLGGLRNLNLNPTKKAKIKNSVWVIVNYFNNNKNKIENDYKCIQKILDNATKQ